LQRGTGVPPAQHCPNAGPAQHVSTHERFSRRRERQGRPTTYLATARPARSQ
jgi:hypothetical protein